MTQIRYIVCYLAIRKKWQGDQRSLCTVRRGMRWRPMSTRAEIVYAVVPR